MKKIILLPLLALLGAASASFATPPASCPPGDPCTECICCEIKPADGESVAAAQKRVMAYELARLVTRYVGDVSLRGELLRTVKSDPERALDFVARAKATFSETDRACFKRISEHFKC